MKTYNVLVTGIGAIVGYGIIKSLRDSDLSVEITGIDIYDDAVGQKWCDSFIQAKPAAAPDYIDFLKMVMDQNHIDIVFFGTEQEIDRTSHETREDFLRYKKKLVLNNLDIIDLTDDKYSTFQKLVQNGLEKYSIPSTVEGDYQSISEKYGSRFLLKPRQSYAGKGMHIVDDEESFNFFAKGMGRNFMAQKLIGDAQHEYTVGIFAYDDGTYSKMICLRRRLSQEGATAKATVVHDEKLENTVMDILKVFKAKGPTNLQFRFSDGEYKLLEINPRISSSTSIRKAFGYNEAEMCVRYYLENKKIEPNITDGHACRFIDDAVWYK